jgi:hypothetical protein
MAVDFSATFAARKPVFAAVAGQLSVKTDTASE